MSKLLKRGMGIIVVLALLFTTVFSGIPGAIPGISENTVSAASTDCFAVQFTAKDGITPAGGTVKLGVSESGITGKMEVSYDKGDNWEEIEKLTTAKSIGTNPIMFKGTSNTAIGVENLYDADGTPTSISTDARWVFTPDISGGKTKASGNIETLLDYQVVASGQEPTKTDFTYAYMFYRCYSLIEAPELPATTLAPSSYNAMFTYCTLLTTAPELPATTVASNSYESMFSYCTLLTTAPELPATTLDQSCYSSMFWGSGLVYTPELPATTLADSCYRSMFRNCLSLIEAPKLPATIAAGFCYSYMFLGCKSLEIAPELPATTVGSRAYRNMFQDCSSLKVAPELPGTQFGTYAYDGMFRDCISLETAPNILATNEVNNMFVSMFSNCSSLSSIRLNANYWRNDGADNAAFGNWVQGVAEEGTFYCPEGLPDIRGDSNIPPNWTRVTGGALETGENQIYEYNGNAIKPVINLVTYAGVGLTPASPITNESSATGDYCFTYGENINAGYGTITVTGINGKDFEVAKHFIILAKRLNIYTTMSGVKASYTYQGSEIYPECIVTDTASGINLIPGKDYRVDGANNRNVGMANALIRGQGNYIGVFQKTFLITAKNINSVRISTISDQVYTGLPLTPSLNVTDTVINKTLVLNQDYTAGYGNNIAVGIANITITGKGNYEGKVGATFNIKSTPPLPAKAKIGKLVSKKKKTLVISWKAVPTATKYRITYSLNKKFKKGKKFGTKSKIVNGKLKLTVKKLKSKKKYFVKLEAGNNEGFGLASATKSKKIK